MIAAKSGRHAITAIKMGDLHLPTSPAVDKSVIRADRELLADLARLNSDVTPLAMRIMDNRATFTNNEYSPTGSPSSAFGFTSAHIRPDW